MNGRLTVLIAEDEPEVRSALSELIMSERSLELVGWAADATEAIELAAAHRPDVALVDVKMPAGGGPTATRGIVERSPGTRVVALSAHDDRETVLQMLQAGAVGYLVKGTPVSVIVETIHRSARGEGSLSAEVTADVISELARQLRQGEGESRKRREQASRIRRVLSGEGLSVVFQPIVELSTGHVSGAEALSRFHLPPKQGPDVWFAEADAVGLRPNLEVLAAELALSCLQDLPPGTYLSINLSPETASSPPLAELLSSVAGERMVIELTEHAPVTDYASLSDALSEARSRGVRLAVDDAGAGFASLRHILQLAPDFIKLDVTLTRSIDRDRSRRALAAGLISFAAELPATIVAEGIETEGELNALRELGVHYGQGYYLGRPQPLPLASMIA
ncbi:MAG: EAL domain-containing protein [Actinomycetota bacterium]